jgi:hypothetical protein
VITFHTVGPYCCHHSAFSPRYSQVSYPQLLVRGRSFQARCGNPLLQENCATSSSCLELLHAVGCCWIAWHLHQASKQTSLQTRKGLQAFHSSVTCSAKRYSRYFGRPTHESTIAVCLFLMRVIVSAPIYSETSVLFLFLFLFYTSSLRCTVFPYL